MLYCVICRLNFIISLSLDEFDFWLFGLAYQTLVYEKPIAILGAFAAKRLPHATAVVRFTESAAIATGVKSFTKFIQLISHFINRHNLHLLFHASTALRFAERLILAPYAIQSTS